MKQNITCRDGKCIDAESLASKFNFVFDQNNAVEQIRFDLLKSSMYARSSHRQNK
ncbi:hypothetical protein HOK51_08340 [Candidatus Woesearchaeota archaeon]|jgi:hypothetical protein|nr:hypothetical protein [Candidatus Woesearchaeota archaeon]MBT6519834.1 hypothetical protein [Candidatus Woesearchaeota archaeon]MBT7366893.1 hypothetical protein [Candidatus Woesearchaeota archaeon]